MPQLQDAMFRALADPTRRGLFERLCREGDTTVVGLLAGAGVSQPVVSKHLKILKAAGLVHDRHEGRYTYYSAERDGLRSLIDWTSRMTGFWNDRFDDLDNLLRRMDQ
ncbi:ArsR/SmtB family transcription factor [Aminobacter sp. Piv2-1]|uniref:ArsR/SmtB family transcription factor n=1 Tax=Aminobacter sp. Piv2-1 TaxID=3031122 RepID=UPI0030B0F78A